VVSDIHGPQYHPRSVTVECRDGAWCVVDASYAGAVHVSCTGPGEWNHLQAERRATVRRGVIKAALTRRANKARAAAAELDQRRAAACREAGVTWQWLTTGEYPLSPAEADAWLGLD